MNISVLHLRTKDLVFLQISQLFPYIDFMKPLYLLLITSLILFANCSQQKGTERDDSKNWACIAPDTGSVPYLRQLGCESDWALLEGKPLSSAHGQASSVKFAFALQSGSVFFVNSNMYSLHFDFAQENLALTEAELANWNTTQYRENVDRSYVLGTLDHYAESGIYTLQLFPGDDLSAERLQSVFEIIQANVWYGKSLLFLPLNEMALARANAAGIPTISIDSLHNGQLFQSMNPGEAYGTLVRAPAANVESETFGRHDIILTDGLPNSLSVVAGVITTMFQTPLSHINVLSKNRHTPNMALRNSWNNPDFLALEGKLTHLVVTEDSFLIEAASIEEAQAFWDSTGPGEPPPLPLDSNPALLDVEELELSMIPRVGAKAANFGELATLFGPNSTIGKVPEAGFAIPFIHYLNHMERHGLKAIADSLMKDPLFQTDAQVRRTALDWLQKKIIAAPMDSTLLKEVEQKVSQSGYTRMRFRSSTNAEDIEGFNGAGLYSSYTGILGSTDKPIANAIRKVWASLWNYRAFEERDFFRIDQSRVAMGVLVHRGFPDEGANGVAFTNNIYKPESFGYVINVQAGDVSVVTPPPGVQCEQFIYYPLGKSYVGEPSIDPISRSTITNGEPVLSEAEIVRLGNALQYVEMRYHSEPMDVEFKFDGVERTLYLKQARPAP